jgi:hypothetical protein
MVGEGGEVLAALLEEGASVGASGRAIDRLHPQGVLGRRIKEQR